MGDGDWLAAHPIQGFIWIEMPASKLIWAHAMACPCASEVRHGGSQLYKPPRGLCS